MSRGRAHALAWEWNAAAKDLNTAEQLEPENMDIWVEIAELEINAMRRMFQKP